MEGRPVNPVARCLNALPRTSSAAKDHSDWALAGVHDLQLDTASLEELAMEFDDVEDEQELLRIEAVAKVQIRAAGAR